MKQGMVIAYTIACFAILIVGVAGLSLLIPQLDLSGCFGLSRWVEKEISTGYLMLRAGFPACVKLERITAEQNRLERGLYSLLNALEADWTDPLQILASELPSFIYIPTEQSQEPKEQVPEEEPYEDEALAALGPLQLPEVVPSKDVEPMQPRVVDRTKEGSVVAIYHTHASELYHQPGMNLEFDSYHLPNSTETGVLQVGKHLTACLESLGVSVTHSLRLHDTPSFTKAYQESAKTVSSLVKENPALAMVFDIHRDGVKGVEYVKEIEGRQTAQILIVVTTNDYLPNPHWQENLAFATELKKNMDYLYPGLCRGIMIVRDSRFNQHLHSQLLLLEIGNYTHTIEPALRSAELLANVIAKMVKEKNLR
jgi:stage II sporulation protein P